MKYILTLIPPNHGKYAIINEVLGAYVFFSMKGQIFGGALMPGRCFPHKASEEQ